MHSKHILKRHFKRPLKLAIGTEFSTRVMTPREEPSFLEHFLYDYRFALTTDAFKLSDSQYPNRHRYSVIRFYRFLTCGSANDAILEA